MVVVELERFGQRSWTMAPICFETFWYCAEFEPAITPANAVLLTPLLTAVWSVANDAAVCVCHSETRFGAIGLSRSMALAEIPSSWVMILSSSAGVVAALEDCELTRVWTCVAKFSNC